MPNFLIDLSVYIRKVVHGLIIRLPHGFRTYLTGSKFLTRIFVYFDDARSQSGSSSPTHVPSTAYEYVEPEFTNGLKQDLSDLRYQPLISIIMPVFNVDPKWLKRAIQSIKDQWYSNWELCIVDDHSSNSDTTDYLRLINNPKIKVKIASKNCGISASSNEALNLASGEYVALTDHDDELTPDALYLVTKAINEHCAEFIYSDEDKLAMDNFFSEPHFKPDYSPDLFFSSNYLSHLGVIKKSLIEDVGGYTVGLEGGQDYDLYLKVLERTNKVTHIPKVLYHWRMIPGSTAANFDDKSYAWDAGARALVLAVERRHLNAEVIKGKYPGTYRVKYVIEGEPLVSIIIPFNDKPELLTLCVESILEKSTYQNFEVLGISNNSEEEATFTTMQRLKTRDARVSFHELNLPFNFSEINNYAVTKHARGKHIILLNNDIEIISPDWIESMLEFSQRPDTGAVGGKLFYPNGQLQHAGIIIGLGGIADHSHKHLDGTYPGYFARPHQVQNLSAVTGACLMVKKDIYKEVNGLDANNLRIAFNDVDFCLRLREKGYLNVYTPYCEAFHHESISRGPEITEEQKSRFRQEVEYMAERHKAILENGDPYYNRQLSLHSGGFDLAEEDDLAPAYHKSLANYRPKLLFMHIAKAAGTTINSFFASHYPENQYATHIESNKKWQSNPEELEKLGFLSGHIELNALQNNLKLEEYYKVTVIREPYYHICSHLAWIKRLSMPGEEQRLKQHPDYIQAFASKLAASDFASPQELTALLNSLTDLEARLIDNCQVRYFTPVQADARVCATDAEEAALASEVFDRIGTTESMGAFMQDVARDMAWPTPEGFEPENVTQNFYGLDLSNEETRDVLKPLVQHDITLYERINAT